MGKVAPPNKHNLTSLINFMQQILNEVKQSSSSSLSWAWPSTVPACFIYFENYCPFPLSDQIQTFLNLRTEIGNFLGLFWSPHLKRSISQKNYFDASPNSKSKSQNKILLPEWWKEKGIKSSKGQDNRLSLLLSLCCANCTFSWEHGKSYNTALFTTKKCFVFCGCIIIPLFFLILLFPYWFT